MMRTVRVMWFLRLVFRPHPYAYPCPLWDRWTRFLVGPREAWDIAGIVSGVTYPQPPQRHPEDAVCAPKS